MKGEQKSFRTRDGVDIFLQIREVGSKKWLICTHGIGEHSNRHQYLTDLLGQHYNILYYDLRGHGKSGGERAWVNNFGDLMLDLKEIVNYLEEEYRMEEYVLFGHSMGGLITAGFLQRYVDKHLYPSKVFINAPPAGFCGILGNIIGFMSEGFLASLAGMEKGIYLGKLVDQDYLSHDPNVKEDYNNDKLNCIKLNTKLLLGMIHNSRLTFSHPINPQCKAFCTVGSEDKIVDPIALKNYFNEVEKKFHFKIIDGSYHEIHNEISRFKNPYFEHIKDSLA